MAKQISPLLKLKGNIDGLSFYKTQDGYIAREKGGVDGERLKSDPAFKNTRRHGLEFTLAAKAGKHLRMIFGDEINNASDNRHISRITKTMVAIVKSDPVNKLGQRKVELGNLAMLKDFEFNTAAPLSAVFKKIPQYTVDRPTGQVSISLPAYIPEEDIAAPKDLKHYNFFAAAAAIDFETGEYNVVRQALPNNVYDETPVAAAAISLALPPASDHPIFVMLGVEFVALVNGFVYTKSRKLSSLQLVEVSLP